MAPATSPFHCSAGRRRARRSVRAGATELLRKRRERLERIDQPGGRPRARSEAERRDCCTRVGPAPAAWLERPGLEAGGPLVITAAAATQARRPTMVGLWLRLGPGRLERRLATEATTEGLSGPQAKARFNVGPTTLRVTKTGGSVGGDPNGPAGDDLDFGRRWMSDPRGDRSGPAETAMGVVPPFWTHPMQAGTASEVAHVATKVRTGDRGSWRGTGRPARGMKQRSPDGSNPPIPASYVYSALPGTDRGWRRRLQRGRRQRHHRYVTGGVKDAVEARLA